MISRIEAAPPTSTRLRSSREKSMRATLTQASARRGGFRSG